MTAVVESWRADEHARRRRFWLEFKEADFKLILTFWDFQNGKTLDNRTVGLEVTIFLPHSFLKEADQF